MRVSKKSGSGVEVRIILLPDSIFPHNVEDPAMKIVKAQLSQMINYIKTNPSKKYENINKLLPKRFPTTTALAELLLYDSANYVIHWVADSNDNKSIVNGRFDFYGRVTAITNLVKRVEGKGSNKNLVKTRKDLSKSSKHSKQIVDSVDINKVASKSNNIEEGTSVRGMN